jgi:hypothetical protein
MKRLALSFALAALTTAAVRAQDNTQDKHYGPVVYPTNTSPEAVMAPDTNAAPADSTSGQSFASNATPAAPGDNPVTLPPADASATATPTPDASHAAPPPATSTTTPDSSAGNTATPPDASMAAPGNGPSSQPTGAANPTLAPLQGLSSAPTAANGKPEDIDDIQPPYFYLKPLTWLWVLLGVLVLVALIVALVFFLKGRRIARAKSAYELALEKLEKARALLNDQNPEPYAVLVSETVRSYLGQRFHTPSTRRTTEEFLRQMQADTSTPLAEHRDLLRGFLESCDLVKFAHYQPGIEELEQVQQRAVSFVTATRPLEGAPA